MLMFSQEYETDLLLQHQATFNRLLELAEQRANKLEYIQQKEGSKFYDDVSMNT